jgi:hypothetical protein
MYLRFLPDGRMEQMKHVVGKQLHELRNSDVVYVWTEIA